MSAQPLSDKTYNEGFLAGWEAARDTLLHRLRLTLAVDDAEVAKDLLADWSRA